MKLNIYKVFAILFILLLMTSCYNDFSTNIRIEGIPTSLEEANIILHEIKENELHLFIKHNNEDIVIKISPWNDKIELDRNSEYSLNIESFFQPDGPSYFMIISKDNKSYFMIGDNIRRSNKTLPDLRISQGKIIKKMDNSKRYWVYLKITNNNENFYAKPGKIYKLNYDNNIWNFILLGASIPIPNDDLKDDQSGSVEISDERPQLIADFIIYRGDI